jgi:hypothetical protein
MQIMCYMNTCKTKNVNFDPQGEYRYSSTLSLTSAIDGDGWLTPRPGPFATGKKTRYPLYQRLGGPQGRSGRMRKPPPPSEFDLWTVQLIASGRKYLYLIKLHFFFVLRSFKMLPYSTYSFYLFRAISFSFLCQRNIRKIFLLPVSQCSYAKVNWYTEFHIDNSSSEIPSIY